MGERGDRPPAPAQREKPLAGPRDPPLQQNRERRPRKSGQRAATRGGVGDGSHGYFPSRAADGDDGAVRLHDCREEGGLGEVGPRPGEHPRLRHAEPALPRQSEDLGLVGSGPVGGEISERNDHARREAGPVLEHGFE